MLLKNREDADMAQYVDEFKKELDEIYNNKKLRDKFNTEIFIQSAVNDLQIKYTLYKKAVTNFYNNTWYDNNGTFCYIGDINEQRAKVNNCRKDVETALTKLNMVKEFKVKLEKAER